MSDKPIRVQKHGMTIRLSDELRDIFTSRPNDEPTGHLEPPTPEEVAEHDAWRAAFEPLHEQGIARGWYTDGGPDFPPEFEGPRGRWVWGS